MKVSIVIPNFFQNKSGRIVPNGDEELWFAEKCFERIKRYTTIPYELILIDNGSVHGQDLLKKWADILITNETNLGFAKGCNQGFKRATGDWVCCVNNDILVFKGWLEALLRTFEDNSNCGVAMPALFKETKDPMEVLKIEEPDLSMNYDKYGAGAEFGSTWLIKREFLEHLKEVDGCYFDENFKIGFGEDRDLWRRVRRQGKETYRTHKIRVYHCGNVTMGKIENRKKYTLPNREYLRRMIELEKDNRRLTEEERKRLRDEVETDFRSGKISIK